MLGAVWREPRGGAASGDPGNGYRKTIGKPIGKWCFFVGFDGIYPLMMVYGRYDITMVDGLSKPINIPSGKCEQKIMERGKTQYFCGNFQEQIAK